MKILTIHADFIEFEARKKAFKGAEEGIKEGKQKVDECLVVFTAVEKRDEKDTKKIVERYIEEIKDIAKKIDTKTIVLYPYAHLSSSLSNPKTAEEVMKEAEKILSEDYDVSRAPFGWYKSFNVSCKGHPLSELSREFSVEESDDVTSKNNDNKDIKDNDNKEKPEEETKRGETKEVKGEAKEKFHFSLNRKKLTAEEKVKLSTAVVIAKAVKELFQNAEVGISDLYHQTAFVDISGVKLKTDDLPRIEKKAKEIIKNNYVFGKEAYHSVESKFQKEILEDLGKEAEVYFLSGMSFVSLYKEPFVYSTKEIASFKILNLASAYWKNNADNPQLERIYCVGFDSKEGLEEFNKSQEEAERRDHRKLGKQLELFSVHEEAPGMPFFHDKGTFIFNSLVEFMTEEMKKLDYEINKTPIILNKRLWLQSGHWDHYKENMYFTKIDGADFAVKPMNCPGNILIFKSKVHSYKELPIKAGEFGLVHRHELSGVLSGLFRVRVFTQDDAHIFCTEEQIKDQIIELLDLVKKIYSTFGFEYSVELSTKPDKAMGDPKKWEIAEKALADALDAKKIKYKLNPGDGAFYGPKIDFHVRDALERSWQCGTIQLDFQMPEKFDLTFEGNDGKKHRPVMLHRAIYGSVERFMGILIEHFIGKFPLWLNPVQIKVLTITDRNISFAKEIVEKLKSNGFRTELDDRTETMGKKIREAQIEKVNYILTIGDQEQEKKTIAVRRRTGENKFDVNVDEFINQLLEEVERKDIK
ncbi:MAG: threonine--tRNA ligase [Nanoarchaeota archaeon]|nr:threonine--tRNA ligase [Nanoarchaeota archaeon]MBU1632595.1 threonine--tRNA ligase [Nanoarchaeota archaeon]MBU1875556.1 threonine--tRNA ligase [Nanoarchaeota archaeon]